jgi:hypothetical protein
MTRTTPCGKAALCANFWTYRRPRPFRPRGPLLTSLGHVQSISVATRAQMKRRRDSALSKAGWNMFRPTRDRGRRLCPRLAGASRTGATTLRVTDSRCTSRTGAAFLLAGALDRPPARGEQAVDRAGCWGTPQRRASGHAIVPMPFVFQERAPARSLLNGQSCRSAREVPPGLRDALAGLCDGREGRQISRVVGT